MWTASETALRRENVRPLSDRGGARATLDLLTEIEQDGFDLIDKEIGEIAIGIHAAQPLVVSDFFVRQPHWVILERPCRRLTFELPDQKCALASLCQDRNAFP